ncbi:hypothetical protein T484DRAFT_1826016 [Baffinella frigidus]|nr:hypothetical protein T484DRAFT_1826016 [Cryptophyta sp. CCMP2293]
MKEKIGILQNEIEILQNETTAKDKALAVERQMCAKAIAERDAVRSDVNKLIFSYKEKQQLIDQKISEIDKLNSVTSIADTSLTHVSDPTVGNP